MNSNLALLILQVLFGFISWNAGIIVVHQDTVSRAFHVVKLAAFDGPGKGPHSNTKDDDPEWNKQVKNFQLCLPYYINGPFPALVESQGIEHHQ